MANFTYYNRNPYGVEITDCVCRAISLGTGLSYNATYRLLNRVSNIYKCEKLCSCCYNYLLKDLLGYKRYVCKNGELVEDIAKQYPNSKVIIRIEQHLTVSMYGKVADIWDCSEKKVDCYWIVS